MSKTLFFLILVFLINYIYLFPIHHHPKNNLKKQSLKKDDRRLDEDLSDDIVIIHLNDVHCGLNETIGYDGFVLYRNELKKKYKNVLAVDVGDHIQGGALGAITDGEAIMKVMNKIKFDANTVGNHEFDYGIASLENINENLLTKYICANYCKRGENKPILEPYQILEVGDKKIGFIGVLTPITFTKTYIGTIRDNDGNLVYDLLSDKNILFSTIQSYVNEIKEKGADYVILLTHMGMDLEDYTSNELVANLEGVDAVLDGHTHKVYNTTVKDKNGKEVYFTQTGTKLANIGQLIIKTDGTIYTQNIEEVPEPSDTSQAIKVTRKKKERWIDKEMNDFINNLWEEYSDELNIKIGTIDYNIFIKDNESSSSDQIYCRYHECALGDLVADSFKSVVLADASFVNAGTIKANLYNGTITRKLIIDILPYFNSIYVKEINGQALLDALEFGVKNLPSFFSGFPQVSGITFDVNTSIKSPVVVDSNNLFVNITGDRRVSNVKVNGQDLDVNKKYNVSMSSIVAQGGDGYSMFIPFPVVNESVYADNDALISYIKNNLNGKVPDDYRTEDGRINIDKNSTDNEPQKFNISKLNSQYLFSKDILLLLIILFYI